MHDEFPRKLVSGGSFLSTESDRTIRLTPETLDPDAAPLSEAASAFMCGEVLPEVERLESQEPGLMASLLRKAGELGLMGLEIPEAFGGLGLKKSVSARISEALAVEPSFAVSHSVHTSVASLPLVFFGTAEQKRRYLPRLASGEWIGAYALSESHAGTDAMAMRSRAVSLEDGFRLSGEKMWITNAAFANLFTVFARVDDQVAAFLVEREWPGVQIGREEKKLGLKGSSTCRLILDNVPVPAENLLGKVGEGGKIALLTLSLGRFKIAASSVGQAKNLLGIAARYAKERRTFGKPIAEHGLIRQKLAMMAARIFESESMLYHTAGLLDAAFDGIDPLADDSVELYRAAAEEYAIECAMVKVSATETLDYVADEALQIHGGYGYTEEFPVARAWRDARVNRIYEGTNEINRLNIAQLVLRRFRKGRISSDPEYRILHLAVTHLCHDPQDQLALAALADECIGWFGRIASLWRLDTIELSPEATRSALSLASMRWNPRTAWWETILSACRDDGVEYWKSYQRHELPEGRPEDYAAHSERVAEAVLAADGYPW